MHARPLAEAFLVQELSPINLATLVVIGSNIYTWRERLART